MIKLIIKLYFIAVCILGITYNIIELVKIIKEQKNK